MATGGRHGDGQLLVINKVNQTDVLGIELLSWSDEHPVVSKVSESGLAFGKVCATSTVLQCARAL